jgi:hypothetical protein
MGGEQRFFGNICGFRGSVRAGFGYRNLSLTSFPQIVGGPPQFISRPPQEPSEQSNGEGCDGGENAVIFVREESNVVPRGKSDVVLAAMFYFVSLARSQYSASIG